MFLERIYYHEPFAKIILSFDLIGTTDTGRMLTSLQAVIEEYPILNCSVCCSDNGACRFIPGSQNIPGQVVAYRAREDTLRALLDAQMDPEDGHTAWFWVQPLDGGLRVWLGIHHIIGDGISLLELAKRVLEHYGGRPLRPLKMQDYDTYYHGITPNPQMQALSKLIDKKWKKQPDTADVYHRRLERLRNIVSLQVHSQTISAEEYQKLLQTCREMGVSVTAYLTAALFQRLHPARVSLPVDLRHTPGQWGNFVGRIDLSGSTLPLEAPFEELSIQIHSKIQQAAAQRQQLLESQRFLSDLEPTFLDHMIASRYDGKNDPFANRIAKLMGLCGEDGQIFLSNLKRTQLYPPDGTAVEQLFFYPPGVPDRMGTMGVVSTDCEMTITWQHASTK